MEWSTFEEVIEPANMEQGVVSLPATVLWGMVDVKEQYGVVEEVVGSGIELSCVSKKEYELPK